MNNLLNEEWLNALPRQVEENMRRQNAEVISVICRRIKYFGDLRPTEIKMLSNSIAFAGADLKQIERIIKKYTDLNTAEIKKLFEAAAKENDVFAEQYYKHRGLMPLSTENNSYLKSLLYAAEKSTLGTFQNLSDTYGFKFQGERAMTLRRTYTRVIDKAIYEISTGVTDYNTAMRKSVKQLADSGIRTVEWESGVTRRTDTAARMNILDGVRRLNQEMLIFHGEQYGSDGVELSAHAISAPDHMFVQGHQFANEEFNKMQEGQSCTDVNGREYEGFERPISNCNCRHIAFPIIVGISQPAYTDEQLEKMAQNSREQYDNTQKMRAMETKLRQLKNQHVALSSSGDILEARRVQRQINEKTKEYKAFCQKTGLISRYERTKVSDYKNVSTKVLTTNKTSDNIKMYRKGNTHRRISDYNTSIIDKPTYHKITNPIVKQGADIRIAKNEWLEHLKENNATAVTIADVIYFREDATVSDVLEETHHFLQNKKGLNNQYNDKQRTILNEIDAKEYLLSVTEKYHIPDNEVKLTKNQLENYKKQMQEMKERNEWDD